MGSSSGDASIGSIAIVGMSGRFPGAKNLDEFWRNLRDGVESVSTFSDDELAESGVDPATAGQPGYVRAAAVLDDIELFDAGFFGFSPREAQILDPQQRLFLECAWEAMEDAGTAPATFNGPIAVYAGQNISNYLLMNLFPRRGAGVFVEDFQTLMGNAKDYLATRVSYKLNLTGPSISVQTACSTSLVAVCMACQSLLSYECDMALAGGVTVRVPQKTGYRYEPGGILSPDGHCRTFDARAQGTLLGSGLGIVALRRLDDAIAGGDRIHAVILGSAINNDGAQKIGYTAPGMEGQSSVVAMAQAVAGVKPETITCIEAHGTGTPLGDPIEINALTRVFRAGTAKKGFCAIGSVKTNFGHLEAAAGIAGLIKTVLALKHRQLPPSLHFENPNPEIDFTGSPFYVNTKLSEWESNGGPLRAGVSSFGIGGTNAHVVLEEAPAREAARSAAERPLHVLAFSARSNGALRELAARYTRHFADDDSESFADACFTANTGRVHFAHRAAVVAASAAEAREKLVRVAGAEAGRPPRLAFLFTGQGSQYAQTGRQLYETQPTFRKEVQKCTRLLGGEPEPGSQTALFALQYGLARLWQSWGVRPAAALGHSVGEYAAACVAGVVSLEDALSLVTARAELMDRLPRDGAMATVFADEDLVRRAISPHASHVSVAAFNGPENTVISGRRDLVERIAAELETNGIRTRSLPVPHAFHSPLMEPILASFERQASQCRASRPEIDLVSGLTGELVSGHDAMDARYWTRHAREPVRFAAGMHALARCGCEAFLEIGPAATLVALGNRCLTEGAGLWLPSLSQTGEWRQLLESLGVLYTRGWNVDWPGFDRDYRRSRISLPTYPFERMRYWVERPKRDAKTSESNRESAHPLLGRRLHSPLRETQFEREANADLLPLLQDHRIHGVPVFPATGYLELAHAAGVGGADSAYVLEDLLILEPMLFREPRDVRTIQTILMPEDKAGMSLRILSLGASDGSSWKEHATGKISMRSDPVGCDEINRDEILRRCLEEYPAGSFYQGVADRGLSLGPQFRWIENIRRRDGEAIAQIRDAREEDGAGDYLVHPGLMDACFQLLGAALPESARESVYLPVEVKRVRFHRPPKGPLWVHALLRAEPDPAQGTMAADIRMFDDEGRVLIETEGLVARRAARVREDSDDRIDDWFYGVEWRPAPRDRRSPSEYFPRPGQVAAILRPRADVLRNKFGMLRYRDLAPEMDALTASYAVEAFHAMDWPLETGGIFTPALPSPARAGKHDLRQRLLDRMIEMVENAGILRRSNGVLEVVCAPARTDPRERWSGLMALYPEFEAELTLLERCGSHMAKLLRGECGGLDILFPGGSSETLEKLYRESPVSRVCNSLAQEAVSGLLQSLPADRTVRVLEIGGGTGGTTWYLLPELRSRAADYAFTDVSPLLTAQAEARFQSDSFVRCRPLDIERDPVEQGFALHAFDLIVAAHVLHATADLRRTLSNVRRLLAPGGMLLLLEGTAPEGYLDLIFGLTEGWWKFADRDLRPSHPLLSQEKWLGLLEESGFEHTVAMTETSEGDAGLSQPAVILARARAVQPSGKWLIFADGQGLGNRLAGLLARDGETAVLVSRGAGFAKLPDGNYTVDPAQPADFERLLQEIGDTARRRLEIVHLWSLDHSTPDSQLNTCGSVLHLVQAMQARGLQPPRLTLVTRGARSIADSLVSPAQAPLWGLGRVIALEHPVLQSICVDLDSSSRDSETDDLLSEIRGGHEENQVAFRGGSRYVARLQRLLPGPRAFRLESNAPGVLDQLALRPITPVAPGAGEVQIRVRATGLNFRDVLNALGLYPGDAGPLGNECAGTITGLGEGVTGFQPGDEVIALAGGSFATLINANAGLVVRKPPVLTHEEAASLPIVFLTAWHALYQLAKIAPGERVLIHAAAGGVGLAAVQLAQKTGAVVFATAGSPEKRAYLRSLGVAHVMNSRTLDFAEEVMALTGGEGVDVVLNSLAGDFIPRSLSILRSGGRFLEIGKNAVWAESQAVAFRPGVSYFVIALDAMIADTSGTAGAMLGTLMKEFGEGSLKPLPLHVFPLEEAAGAFRFMAQAKHIGKIVIGQSRNTAVGEAPMKFRSDASYWIAGGLGGLGLLTAEWMVERGARNLVLIGRSGPSAAAAETVRRIEKSGAAVMLAQGDIARGEFVSGLLAKTPSPLRGVVHCAGVLDDGILARQQWDRFAAVLAPKVIGTWNLHAATAGLPLDFFVLFSSTASLIGSPGQGNHAAANAFCDALAHYRRAQGLPGLSLNWGPWSDVGTAARHVAGPGFGGIDGIAPRQGLRALERALQQGYVQAAVLPIRWREFSRQFPHGAIPPFLGDLVKPSREQVSSTETIAASSDLLRRIESAAPPERRPLLFAEVRNRVSKALGVEPAMLDARQPLNEMGLDSLMAVELRNTFGLAAGRTLPATLLFDYPTIETLAEYFARELFPAGFFPEPDYAVSVAAEKIQEDSAKLDRVSGEEMAALLMEKLALLEAESLP